MIVNGSYFVILPSEYDSEDGFKVERLFYVDMYNQATGSREDTQKRSNGEAILKFNLNLSLRSQRE